MVAARRLDRLPMRVRQVRAEDRILLVVRHSLVFGYEHPLFRAATGRLLDGVQKQFRLFLIGKRCRTIPLPCPKCGRNLAHLLASRPALYIAKRGQG